MLDFFAKNQLFRIHAVDLYARGITAAWNGSAPLALSNADRGIAVQTFFIAAADIAYPNANLEQAAYHWKTCFQGQGC